MMVVDLCGSSWLLALPNDVFVMVCGFLSPVDMCCLGLCCRSLCALVEDEKVWIAQCEKVGIVEDSEIVEWRKGVFDYKALCRFLVAVQGLLGIWVHQNPELGNVVYVMPGFLSVVGCRIIPQEIGPFGIEEGPLLWAPVFEVVANFDGSALFFLHGREKGSDYLYPGSVKAIDKGCNVILLEVEPRQRENGGKLLHSKSVVQYCSDVERSSEISRTYSGISRLQRLAGSNEEMVSFCRLSFSDRRRLLDIVTSQVRLKLPDSAIGPLFLRLKREDENTKKDVGLLYERRQLLMQMCQLGGGSMDWKENPKLQLGSNVSDPSASRKSIDQLNGFVGGDDGHIESAKKKTIGGYFRDGIKQIFRRSSSFGGARSTSNGISSSSESKYAQLCEFLRSGDTIGLTLHARNKKLSSYRAWPNMHESRFALYKLPLRAATVEREFAGLWGGAFGWPPVKPSPDKPGQALFLLLLSYEECQGRQLLIATKILEGTHYVVHPNGSAMFIANIDEPSLEQFPWDTDADSNPVIVKNAFDGDGITNGYGFRYPGSKPGSLFVIQNGLLVFIWKDSRAVLTLRRLNLQELLKKGDRVPALPPIANFSYLTKSYSNVFSGFPSTSACLSSPRGNYI